MEIYKSQNKFDSIESQNSKLFYVVMSFFSIHLKDENETHMGIAIVDRKMISIIYNVSTYYKVPLSMKILNLSWPPRAKILALPLS